MNNSINRIISTEESIFDNVKDTFISQMNYIANNVIKDTTLRSDNINLCCSEEEKTTLLDIAVKIKENEDVIGISDFNVSFKDICYAVIYTYYGLNLNEDLYYFNLSVLPRNINNKIIFKNLDDWDDNEYKQFNFWINTITDNISIVYYLYIRLGMPSNNQPNFGDIITRDGENLSRKLRQFIIYRGYPSTTRRKKPAKSSRRLVGKFGGKKSRRSRKQCKKSNKTKRKRKL